MQKYDIVDTLAAKYDFRSVLQIATPTTGKSYGKIDRRQLFCRRLLYRCRKAIATAMISPIARRPRHPMRW
jgi:hypothetical protein